MSRSTQYALLILVLLAVIPSLLGVYFSDTRHLQRYTQKIEYFLQERENEVDAYLSRVDFKPELSLQVQVLEKNWGRAFYNIAWYDEDSLLFSLNSRYLPKVDALENAGPYVLHMDNSKIYIGKQISGTFPRAVVWLPVWEAYESDSPFFETGFTHLSDIPEEILAGSEASDFPIRGVEGPTGLYLRAQGPFSDPLESGLLFGLFLGIGLVICYLINQFALHLSNRYSPWWGLLFLTAFVVTVRLLLNPYLSPGAEVSWIPEILQQPILQQTLAGLLLNTFFLLWLMLFFYQKFETLSSGDLPRPLAILLSAVYYLGILLGMLLIAQTIRNIVLYSSLNLYWENLFAIDVGGILAISTLILLFLAFFLFSHRMGRLIASMNLSPIQRILAFGFSLIAIIPFFMWSGFHFPLLYFSVAAAVYMVILDFFSELESPNLTWLIIWLTAFSGLTALLLSNFNVEKEDRFQAEMVQRLTEVQRGATVESFAHPGTFEAYVQSSIRGYEFGKRMEYALYQQGELVEKTAFEGISLEEEWMFEHEVPDSLIRHASPGRVDWIYHNANGASAIVSRPVSGWMRTISVFSYLFALFIVIMPLLVGLNYWLRFLPYSLDFTQLQSPSLSNRIQLWVIGFLLISFFCIGLFSIWNYRQTANFNQEVLIKEKIDVIRLDAQERIQKGEPGISMDSISRMLLNIGHIQRMDLWVFDSTGLQSGSTFSPAMKEMLATHRLPGTVKYSLSRGDGDLELQAERIGELNFNTAYLPIFSTLGNPLAYVGLPFVQQSNLWKQELSGFISTLINVYVLLLLLAGIFAIFIADSITRPISQLGESLRKLELGKNEPLEYTQKDELGALIEEYNRMLKKLEESTQKLAQSERDFAWREMAKQVAHEIKNPLTPMKLKIQQLQLAMKEKPEKTLEMLPALAKTILKQIQTLDDISTAFRNFAKLPEPKNALFSLTELLESVHTLFLNDEAQAELVIDIPKENIQVFADESHLTRVFNNIYTNAIQAIPPDRKGKIETRLFERDGFVVVQISDNGSGIAKEMQEKVFEPNFTTKSSGSGLGMAISKNIVELARGRIYFKTELDLGTDFFVELPTVNKDSVAMSEG